MPPNDDVLAPIQQAMHTRMTGDAALTGRVTGVFDEVPSGQDYPYVVHGEHTSTGQGEGAHDRYGRRSTVTLHVWSAYHGTREMLAVVGDLLRLFDLQPLTVDGHRVLSVRQEQTVTMRDPDRDLRHAAVRFAVTTQTEAA